MVQAKLDGFMKKNSSRSVFITLNKTEIQVDQRPQHKARCTEPGRIESG